MTSARVSINPEESETIESSVSLSNIPGYTVTKIQNSGFRNDTVLKEITLPSSITKIGANAFRGCTNLKSITCLAVEPPVLFTESTPSFDYTLSDCVLRVPAESVEKYKNSDWNQYFTDIIAA